MENNWEEKAKELLANNFTYDCIDSLVKDNELRPDEVEYITDAMLEFGKLVLEAAKKECADKAKVLSYTGIFQHQNREINDIFTTKDDRNFEVDKDSILNIGEPNL